MEGKGLSTGPFPRGLPWSHLPPTSPPHARCYNSLWFILFPCILTAYLVFSLHTIPLGHLPPKCSFFSIVCYAWYPYPIPIYLIWTSFFSCVTLCSLFPFPLLSSLTIVLQTLLGSCAGFLSTYINSTVSLVVVNFDLLNLTSEILGSL